MAAAAMGRRLASASVALAIAVAGSGCGSDERTFTPESFIDAMNSHGAALALGPVLTTNPDGDEIYTVTLTELAPSATGEGRSPASGGSATLIVVADSDLARAEFERCERAPLLTCFRAANAVLRVEELQPADQARITTALEAIQTIDD